MGVYTGTKMMTGKSNDVRYSVIPSLTFCVTVHYVCHSVRCHGDGITGYGASASPDCDKCLEFYPVTLCFDALKEGFHDFE